VVIVLVRQGRWNTGAASARCVEPSIDLGE